MSDQYDNGSENYMDDNEEEGFIVAEEEVALVGASEDESADYKDPVPDVESNDHADSDNNDGENGYNGEFGNANKMGEMGGMKINVIGYGGTGDENNPDGEFNDFEVDKQFSDVSWKNVWFLYIVPIIKVAAPISITLGIENGETLFNIYWTERIDNKLHPANSTLSG